MNNSVTNDFKAKKREHNSSKVNAHSTHIKSGKRRRHMGSEESHDDDDDDMPDHFVYTTWNLFNKCVYIMYVVAYILCPPPSEMRHIYFIVPFMWPYIVVCSLELSDSYVLDNYFHFCCYTQKHRNTERNTT